MVAAIYKEGSVMVEHKFQIIYDVQDDVDGIPPYRWVDLASNDKSEESFDTAKEAEEDYNFYIRD